jgi:hypothetical protein
MHPGLVYVRSYMNVRLGQRLVRLAAGVWTALLAGTLFAPAVARAECGSYVVMGSRPVDGAQPAPAAASHAVHHAPVAPGKPFVPCTGPHCSRGSVPLVPPPTAPAPVRTEQWGCASLDSVRCGAEPGTLPLERCSLHPVYQDLAVYHPPR